MKYICIIALLLCASCANNDMPNVQPQAQAACKAKGGKPLVMYNPAIYYWSVDCEMPGDLFY